MKVILYMAMSADGYIAKPDHETPWSDAELESYTSHVQEAGNIIIGRKTYDLMVADDAFKEIGNPLVVVMSSKSISSNNDKVIFVKSFPQALNVLKEKGFKQALVSGGSKLNAAALQSGALDEIFIDVEPLIFGKGIPLFAPVPAVNNLRLIETKQIGKSGLQLHYQVLK